MSCVPCAPNCEPTGLVFTPELIFFGDIFVSKYDFTPYQVEVKNSGKGDIHIHDVRVVVGEDVFSLVSQAYPTVLRSGQKFMLQVQVRIPNEMGDYAGVLEIVTDEVRINYSVGIAARFSFNDNIDDLVDGKINETKRYVDETRDQLNSEIVAKHGEAMAAVREESWVRASAIEAEAGHRLTLEAKLGNDIEAKITQEQIARANQIEALATSTEELIVRFKGESDASIEAERTARATAISAEATSREKLGADLRLETDTKVSAAILDERTVRVDAEAAIAKTVTDLRADMESGGADNKSYTDARIQEERTARASAIEASATETRGLFANYQTTTQVGQAIQTATAAEATARTQAISTAVSAEATRVDNMLATFSSGAQNLLTNTDLDYDLSGWEARGANSIHARNGITPTQWWPVGVNSFVIGQENAVDEDSWFVQRVYGLRAGKIVQLQLKGTAHRTFNVIALNFYDRLGNLLGNGRKLGVRQSQIAFPTINDWQTIYLNIAVPAGTHFAEAYIGKIGTDPGQANSYAWFAKPQLSEVPALTSLSVPYISGSAGAMIIRTNARVDNEASARATAVQAEATRTDNLVANYTTLARHNADIGNVQTDRLNGDNAVRSYADAKVTDEATARSNAIQAESASIRGLFAGYATTGALNSAISAEVINRDNAIASSAGGLATQISGVRATAEGADSKASSAVSSASSAQATANAAIAKWGLRLDVNGYVSGMEANNNGQTSTLIFNSDMIQFRKPGGGAGLNMSGGELWSTDPAGNKRARFGYWG